MTNGTRNRRRNSPIGVHSTSICQIIEACGRNGVSKISLADGTMIEFVIGSIVNNQQQPIDYSPIVVDNRTVEAPLNPQDERLLSSLQIEMELDDLAVNDPVTYEAIVSSRIAEGIQND